MKKILKTKVKIVVVVVIMVVVAVVERTKAVIVRCRQYSANVS